MKKGGATLVLIIIIFIIGAFFVLTEEANKLYPVPAGQLPEPGLTPSSPFYFIDSLTENFLLFIYLEPKKKAEVAFRLSKEKLAEAEFLEQREVSSLVIEEVNKKAAAKSRELYEKYLTIARENVIKFNEDQALEMDLSFESLDKLLSRESSQAQSLLERIYEILPQPIQNILTGSGNWLQEKKEQIAVYYQEQKSKTKVFFRDYLKQKITNLIDNLFNTKE